MDSCFADETQRRITLLPERLHEDSKVTLKNIFGSLSNVLEELNNKEANDILVRASPKEVCFNIYHLRTTMELTEFISCKFYQLYTLHLLYGTKALEEL